MITRSPAALRYNKSLAHEAPARHNPPWLFGVLSLPYGIGNAIIVILVPYLLRKQGVAVDRIGGIVALALTPAVWYFLYSPVVDIRWRRRTWLLLAAAGAALFSGLALLLSATSLSALTVLIFLASAVSGLLSSAIGAVLTTLPPATRGRASGWYQAGNLGGGAIGGGLAIWIADHSTLPALAFCSAAMIGAPALAALLIHEQPSPPNALGPQFRHLFRDLLQVVKSRRTLIGLVFFLSPVGSAAVANLIAGLGPDYRASSNEVLLVTGIAGGLLSALGSLLGGWVCDRVNSMRAYAAAGGLSAVFAACLGFARPTPFVFGAGYSGYAIAAGFAYAVFTALVLDVLGARRVAAGTAYSLLVASGNLPIVYMTWLDGVGYKHRGALGLMGVDALANGAGALALLWFATFARRAWDAEREPQLTAP